MEIHLLTLKESMLKFTTESNQSNKKILILLVSNNQKQTTANALSVVFVALIMIYMLRTSLNLFPPTQHLQTSLELLQQQQLQMQEEQLETPTK